VKTCGCATSSSTALLLTPLLLRASNRSSTDTGGTNTVDPTASTAAAWPPATSITLAASTTRQLNVAASPGARSVRSALNHSMRGSPPAGSGVIGAGGGAGVPVLPGVAVAGSVAAGVGVAAAMVGEGVAVGAGVLVATAAGQTSANDSTGGLPALSTVPGPHTQPSTWPGLISLLPAPKLEYCQPAVPSRQYDQ
jgi:hypothetical protein